MCRSANAAGAPTSMEQKYRHHAATPEEVEEAGQTRTDITVMGPDGKTYLVDFTISHQHMGCQLDACHRNTGKAAYLAEQRKIREFRLREDSHQYEFVPFAVETHGRLGKQAVAFLHKLAEWASASGRISKSAFLQGAYRDLSCTLQKGNSAMYCKSAERLLRARGKFFSPGAEAPHVP